MASLARRLMRIINGNQQGRSRPLPTLQTDILEARQKPRGKHKSVDFLFLLTTHVSIDKPHPFVALKYWKI